MAGGISSTQRVRSDGRGLLLVLTAAALWSTSGMFIRWILAESSFSALSLAFWRELATFVCLFVGLLLLKLDWPRVSRRDLPWFVILGALGVGTFHVMWNVAVVEIGYAAATILLYSSPVFVSITAWLVWREPLTRVKALAVTLVLCGCILVAGLEELTSLQVTAGGLVLGLGVAMAYGTFSLIGRRLAPRYAPWTVLTYAFAFGAIALAPFQFSVALPRGIPGMLAYLIFGERLRAGQILDALLVVGGVTLVAWKEPI